MSEQLQEIKKLADQLGSQYINLAKVGVQPATDRWVDSNDRLYVGIWNSAASPVVILKGLILHKNGSKSEINHRMVPTTDRIRTDFYFPLNSGYLQYLTIFPDMTTFRGQTFVQVAISRAPDQLQNRNALMIQNYLQTDNALGWPGSRIQDSVEGPGFLRVISGTNPAAGVEVSETVPTNARWRLISIFNPFVTDATAADRRPEMQLIDDVASAYWISREHDAHTASTNIRYHWAKDYEYFAAASATGIRMHDTLPESILSENDSFATTTRNFQAGDDWTAPVYFVEEWIEV